VAAVAVALLGTGYFTTAALGLFHLFHGKRRMAQCVLPKLTIIVKPSAHPQYPAAQRFPAADQRMILRPYRPMMTKLKMRGSRRTLTACAPC
jgi:hypothetical protein